MVKTEFVPHFRTTDVDRQIYWLQFRLRLAITLTWR